MKKTAILLVVLGTLVSARAGSLALPKPKIM